LIPALQPPGKPEIGPDYRLQVGDELHVRFLYQPELDEKVPVRPDGRISLGPTGQLDVLGLTPTELEVDIAERSSDKLRDPEVAVIVLAVGEQRVYVGGEVQRPGYVVLQPGMTPLQAITHAGGALRSGKMESVMLLTPGDDGQFSAARMNMQQVLEEGVPERIRLRANDIVYIQKTWETNASVVVD